jgi:hypothetical protein
MQDEKDVGGAGQTPRERYEKPAVVWEEALDVHVALAAACAKVDPGGGPPCESGSPAS